MNGDKITKIKDIKYLIQKFCDDRDWSQFHDPKNLAEAISIEAAELQELFLWKDKKEIKEKMQNDLGFRKKVEFELADVFTFAFTMANSINMDVTKTLKEKMEINNKKYPIDKSRGISTKYTKL